MADRVIEIRRTPPERKRFRLDDGAFPDTDRELSAWLFNLTGFGGHEDTVQDFAEWRLLNQSLNKGFGLGLDGERGRLLDMLSLLDQALGEVNRFGNVPQMNPALADSTAAHSKQVMRLIHRIFHETFGPSLPPGIAKLKRDAMIGAWVHDMGEIVLELTTADDIYLLDHDQRTEIGHAKDSMERELFAFSCALAEYELHQPIARKGLFLKTIHAMREQARDTLRLAQARQVPRAQAVHDCIASVQQAMAAARVHYEMPEEPGHNAAELLALYDRVEKSEANDFLHPLVKTIESVEGQRYLQRNADRSGDSCRLDLSTSNQTVESIQRIERRLPLLFQRCQDGEPAYVVTTDRRRLALHTADLVYDTIIRSCEERNARRVSLIPPIIDRAADAREEVGGEHLKPESIKPVRARTHALLSERKAALPPGPDNPIYTRTEVGLLYRAAKVEMHAGRWRPLPEIPSLLRLTGEGHRIPPFIARRMEQLAQHSSGQVVEIQNEKGR